MRTPKWDPPSSEAQIKRLNKRTLTPLTPTFASEAEATADCLQKQKLLGGAMKKAQNLL